MRKIYESPVLEVSEIELIDCLVRSIAIPETPMPDYGEDGDSGFDW